MAKLSGTSNAKGEPPGKHHTPATTPDPAAAPSAPEPLVQVRDLHKSFGQNKARSLAADGMTMIVVTHEMAFARDVADRVVFMDGGVVVESGPPGDVLGNPQHDRTRGFLDRALTSTSHA